MQKTLRAMVTSVVKGNGWKKLANPTVNRGKTAFHKRTVDQQRLGVRFDYDEEITIDGIVYHKYQIQAFAGDDIPTTIKQWMDAKGGTHVVMANVCVMKGGSTKELEDVEEGLMAANKTVRGV